MGTKSEAAAHWPTASDLRKIVGGIGRLVDVLEQYAPIKGEPAKFVNNDRSRAAATAHSRISDANFKLRHLVNPDDDDPDRFRDIDRSPVLLEDQRDALHTVAQITEDLLDRYGGGQTMMLRPVFQWSPGRCPDIPRERVAALSAAKTRLGRAKKTDPEVKRRRRPPLQPKRLTAKQIEASKLHGECKGNIAEVARRMGKDRSTAEQHIVAAFTKLGKSVPTKPKTTKLKTDRRGQSDVTKSDDHRE